MYNNDSGKYIISLQCPNCNYNSNKWTTYKGVFPSEYILCKKCTTVYSASEHTINIISNKDTINIIMNS